MFKRSLLSIALVASLACPAVQAGPWEKVSEFATTAGDSARKNWSGFSGAFSAQGKAAKDFTCAVFSPSTYAEVVKAARGAYSNEGFKSASQELVKNKSAVVGAVLTVAVLAAISYVAYKTLFAKKADQENS